MNESESKVIPTDLIKAIQADLQRAQDNLSILLATTGSIITPGGGGGGGSEWTATEIGTGALTSFDDTDGTLTIVAAGNDQDNCVLVWKSIANATDIQLKYRVHSDTDFSGGDASGKGPFVAGVIRNGIAQLDPVISNRWRDNITRHEGLYRVGGINTSGLFGEIGFTEPFYGGNTYNIAADTVGLWESNTVDPVDGTDWIEIATGISMQGEFTFPLIVGFLVVSNHLTNTISVVLDNIDVSDTITLTNSPPAPTRNLRAELDWETGEVQTSTFQNQDGVYKDSMHVKLSGAKGSPRTITDIDSGTSTVSYTGTRINDGDAVTFSDDVGGAVELRNKMVRCKDTTASSFVMYWDGNPGDSDGYNPDKICDHSGQTNPNNKTNSTIVPATDYSEWTSGGTLQGWEEVAHGNGGFGPDTEYSVRVLNSGTFTPPDNDVGSAAGTVSALRGSFLLGTEIHYWRDHAIFSGNSNQNKPRTTLSFGGGNLPFAHNEEEWFSISYFLPSNFDHDPTSTANGVFSRTNLIQVNATGAFEIFHLLLQQFPGDSDMSWALAYGTGGGIEDNLINCGNLIEDGDIGKWTTFIFHMRAHNGANGILRGWKSVGDYTSGLQRDLGTPFINITGSAVGPATTPSVGYAYGLRQYKPHWHHKPTTINSLSQWIGFDEIRWGGENEGTDFTDVDPWSRTEPA